MSVTDSKYWPSFLPVPGFPQAVSCSVCGTLVLDTLDARGQHQLFHGVVWRLAAGQHPLNEVEETALRGWLHEVDR